MIHSAASARVPNSAHEAHEWVIAEIAPDFRLMDVWALPVHGGPGDFASLVETMASLDPAQSQSALTRALFSVRFRLGRWLGWDDATERRSIPGSTETTLSDRLPEGLRGSATDASVDGSRRQASGFTPLYLTDDEFAAEISNATVHGVLHLGWVDQGYGRYQGRLAVYVKPRGKLGEAYLRLIDPFRHLIVYPALMRQIERAWDSREIAAPGPTGGPS